MSPFQRQDFVTEMLLCQCLPFFTILKKNHNYYSFFLEYTEGEKRLDMTLLFSWCQRNVQWSLIPSQMCALNWVVFQTLSLRNVSAGLWFPFSHTGFLPCQLHLPKVSLCQTGGSSATYFMHQIQSLLRLCQSVNLQGNEASAFWDRNHSNTTEQR